MTEILSQDEIDALLAAISTGEVESEEPKSGIDKRKVKIYDFKRPDKFSKDQLRTLQMIHETFARLSTTSLSAQLRALVSVHVASVDQLTYEEFIRSIPNPTTLGIINMDPLKGSAIFEIDPSITFTIIDRLFGGEGQPMKTNRELTEIEQSVMESIIVRLLTNLREAWATVIDLRPRLSQIETNPQFAQIVPPTDMVVLTTFETKVGEVEGMMNFCIPYITIEPIVTKLSAQYWYSSIRKGASSENFEMIKERLNTVYLPVSVELGSTELPVRDILQLKVGDVIKLDTKVTADLKVKVVDRVKFTAKAGIVGVKKAVQITGIIEEISDELIVKELRKGGEEE